MQSEATPDRRTVVAAVLGTSGLGALAACGGGSGTTTSTAQTSSASGGESEGGSDDGGSSSRAASGSLAPLSQVPVGGSVIVQAPSGKVAVAQPSAGKVVAFSAICTHQGCTVMAAGKQLQCPCHGSIFDAFTGAVLQGPAPSPLRKVDVSVSGQDVVAG